ncbi:MAG: class I SAM-dependent methyltransferase [Candidatus Latescibacteria bacterium]|nr:class I SAM-dependent methyltransferase [Candidatus Latescibacterota bacterium]
MNKMGLRELAASQVRKHPLLVRVLRRAAHEVSPETVVLLDYPLASRQRWDEDHPHQRLHEILDGDRAVYRANLQSFLPLADRLVTIPERRTPTTPPAEPCWVNGWMPALDGVALYGFVATRKPRLYVEVGSGNSTKFARRAINDHGLQTKIVSIDPHPRAEIDAICDEVVRKPVEEVDLELFDRLGADDILYVDNSHRVFMNSDATTIFLDVFPRLRTGVLVEIHDVTLPFDYPASWIHRYYSEQYLLAAYLLAEGKRFEVVLPNAFIAHDPELKRVLAPLWERAEMKNVATHGASFWLEIR